MSSEKFLEINSTYRDRTKYQNPANFIITPRNTSNNLSKAYPLYNFQSPTWNLMNVTPDISNNYWKSFKINSKIGGITNEDITSQSWSVGSGNLNVNGTGSSCKVVLDGVANINSSLNQNPIQLPILFKPNESSTDGVSVTHNFFKQSSTEDDYYRGMFIQVWEYDISNN